MRPDFLLPQGGRVGWKGSDFPGVRGSQKVHCDWRATLPQQLAINKQPARHWYQDPKAWVENTRCWQAVGRGRKFCLVDKVETFPARGRQPLPTLAHSGAGGTFPPADGIPPPWFWCTGLQKIWWGTTVKPQVAYSSVFISRRKNSYGCSDHTSG